MGLFWRKASWVHFSYSCFTVVLFRALAHRYNLYIHAMFSFLAEVQVQDA